MGMYRKKHFDENNERQDHISEDSELDNMKLHNRISIRKSLQHYYYLLSRKQRILLLFCVISLLFYLFWNCQQQQDISSYSQIVIEKISNYELLKNQLFSSLKGQSNYYYTKNSQYSRKCTKFTSISSLSSSKQDISVIVYAGNIKHQHPGYANFITSLKLAGFTDIITKEPPGQEILNHVGTPNNTFESIFWVKRLEEFQRIASSYPPNHLLLFCDSFDVMFGLSVSTFLTRFISLNSDIIFSTEMLCDTISCRNDNWLTEWFTERNPNANNNPYRYLNAGLFTGKAQSLNTFLTCSLKYAKNGRDDQTSFALCFHEFHTTSTTQLRVELDYNSLLFGNIPPIDTFFEHNWNVDEEKHIRYENILHDSSQSILDNSFISRKIHYTDGSEINTPVAIHFPGMAYRPTYTLFNPCQQYLRWRYNQIGLSSFSHGMIPNIFHPLPIVNSFKYQLDSQTNETVRKFNIIKTNQPYRILLTLVVEYQSFQTKSHFFDQLYSDLYSIFENNRYLFITKVYLVVISSDTINLNELNTKLQEFQEFVEINIIVFSDQTTSIIQTILQSEPPSPNSSSSLSSSSSLIFLLWLNIFPIHYNFIDLLYKRYLLDPGAVYGFGGWMIDQVATGGGPLSFPYPQWKLKSAALWYDTVTSVDVLDFPSGVLFPREIFDDSFQDYLTSTMIGTEMCGNHPIYSDEDVRISGYLSMKGIPRIQLPKDFTQLKQFSPIVDSISKRQTKWGNSNLRRSWEPRDCNLPTLFNHFKLSILPPMSQSEEKEARCQTNSFQPLRVIDNLPGFSWQLNWDPTSHTSACTTHLMTHASSSAHFLGVGQYLSENRHLISPQGKFMIRLEPGAMLCLYSRDTSGLFSNQPVRCLKPPTSVDSSTSEGQERVGGASRADGTGRGLHYLAIQDGELCFFQGKSPNFGSTKIESGHTRIEWCTSSTYPPHSQPTIPLGRRLLSEVKESSALQAVKNRMRAKIADILQKRVQEEIQSCQRGGNEVEKEYWDSVYLYINDDGIFGIFYSANTSPSERMSPEKRITTFIIAKCF